MNDGNGYHSVGNFVSEGQVQAVSDHGLKASLTAYLH